MRAVLERVRRVVCRAGTGLGLLPRGGGGKGCGGQEMGANWYDEAFAKVEHYHGEYHYSPYYASWSIIVDRLVRDGVRSVLEIGCGTGQMAKLIRERGVEGYTGLDFSPYAVQVARGLNPGVRFVIDDARTSDIYTTTEYEAIICTEVLEHIERDLEVVSRFPAGVRCLCTVPNFMCESHVRCFGDCESVVDRYGALFERLTVTRLKGATGPDDAFFLLDGVRNERVSAG